MSARQRRRRERRRQDAAKTADARRTRVLAGAGIALGVGLGLSSTAQAAPQTFTVGTATDNPAGPPASDCATASNTDCTLRDAIIASNTNANSGDQDTIVFASAITGSANTITLGAPLPRILQSLYISGPGTAPGNSNITIDGNDSYRGLFGAPGGNYEMNLTVSGLTITNGASGGGGGGILLLYSYPHADYPEPSLTVKNSSISGNSAGVGGGIEAIRGSITVQNSDVSDNVATGDNFGIGGGGIYLFPGVTGTLTIESSTISGNVAHQLASNHATGGGVESKGPTTITDSTVSGNHTDGAYGSGGGIYISTGLDGSSIQDSTITGNYTTGQFSEGGGISLGAYGDMDLTGSTIADNHTTGANANGGGIVLHAGSPNSNNAAPSIENTTIADNYTSGTGASGGGMFIYYESHLGITNSTISGNSTENFGGGIYEYGGNSDPTITNSILSGGSAGQQGPELYTGSNTTLGTTFQAAFSLIQNPAGAAIHANPAYSNLTGVDPQLGALADHGGPTYTQEPALTSPVIDCGTSAGATTDQRGTGFDRPVELARTNSTITGADGSDMGAFEVQTGTTSGACANVPPPPPPPSGGGTPTPTPTPTPKQKKCKKKHKTSAQIAKKCKKKK
jgi:hypothetical protein